MRHRASIESSKSSEADSTITFGGENSLTENSTNVYKNPSQFVGEKSAECKNTVDEKARDTFQDSVLSVNDKLKNTGRVVQQCEKPAEYAERPTDVFQNPLDFPQSPLFSAGYRDHVTVYGNPAFTFGLNGHGSGVSTFYGLPPICTCAWRQGGDPAGVPFSVPISLPLYTDTSTNRHSQNQSLEYFNCNENSEKLPRSTNSNITVPQCSMGNEMDSPRHASPLTHACTASKEEDKQSGQKSRKLFTSAQLKALENMFSRYQYIAASQRKVLADSIGISEVQVRVWFQNRRIKWRKQSQEYIVINNT